MSGAGVSINPVAFIVVTNDQMKILPIEHTSAIDKLIDYVPDLMQRVNTIIDKSIENKCEFESENNNDEKTKDKVTNIEIEYKTKVDPNEYLEDE